MKIKPSSLKRLIKEELGKVLRENAEEAARSVLSTLKSYDTEGRGMNTRSILNSLDLSQATSYTPLDIQTALKDLESKGLVDYNGKSGWYLTPSGAQWEETSGGFVS